MTHTVTIAIPIAFTSELPFLDCNLRQISKFKKDEIEQEILVIDQTEDDTIYNKYNNVYDIKVIKAPLCDAGFPLDLASRHATGEVFLSLDVDCIPIHKNWLSAPIKLLKKHNILFIGKNTGLDLHGDYAKWGKFYAINNYFRFSTTENMKKVSNAVGFLRPENHSKVGYTPQVNIQFEPNCDNGVRANFWTDQINMGSKVSLAMNKILGMTNEMGVFGHLLDDLVFHMVFSSSRNWIVNKSRTLGFDYLHWYNRINNENFPDSLLEEMLANLKQHHQILYDRDIFENGQVRKLTPQDEIFRDFAEFKEEINNV